MATNSNKSSSTRSRKSKPTRRKVEIFYSDRETASPKLKAVCLCCEKKLEVAHGGKNGEVHPPIWGGVVFRTTGNFGSRVLDCGVGIPHGWSSEIQIIICDDCLVKKAGIVNAFKNKRAVIERRPFADVAVEWSDYATFEELRAAEEKAAEQARAERAKLSKEEILERKRKARAQPRKDPAPSRSRWRRTD